MMQEVLNHMHKVIFWQTFPPRVKVKMHMREAKQHMRKVRLLFCRVMHAFYIVRDLVYLENKEGYLGGLLISFYGLG